MNISRIGMIILLLISAVANSYFVIITDIRFWAIISVILGAVSFWSAFILIIYELEESLDKKRGEIHAPE